MISYVQLCQNDLKYYEMSAAIDERDEKEVPDWKAHLRNMRQVYSAILSLAGLAIVVLGLLSFPEYENPSILLLLLFFALIASLRVWDRAR